MWVYLLGLLVISLQLKHNFLYSLSPSYRFSLPPVSRPPSPTLPDRVNDAEEPEEETALEEAARAKFGLHFQDRPALYRETAAAATDTDLPFWTVLLLSGAIATLGLALNATAVVIGAMLIAPLLGPVLGLGLGLAVGDGRLALTTAVTIVLGVIGVVALAALLTVLLPFQTVTAEIVARTRPTLLDLAIAVASGLAGAVVTLAREQRLSASIPGVAIAVALIPPLGVAGFGIGTGWQWSLIKGSMLLFGANLAGIVLSAMLAFMLVGMHRHDIVEVARKWHSGGHQRGLAARLEHSTLFKGVRVFEETWARVLLVFIFCLAVAVPLTSTLEQIAREARVNEAIDQAAEQLDTNDRLFILNREVTLGETSARVRLRVATSAWVGDDEHDRFETTATARAGEPITLVLEQVPASAGDLDALAAMLPGQEPVVSPLTPSGNTSSLPSTLALLRGRLTKMTAALALPDSVRVVGAEVLVGQGPPQLRIAYAAPTALPEPAETMLTRQAARELGLGDATTEATWVSLASLALPLAPLETTRLARLLVRFPSLSLAVSADSVSAAGVEQRLTDAGAPIDRIILYRTSAPGRLRVMVTDSTGTSGS